MKTNEIPCFYETDDSFGTSKAHVNIAYVESLNSLCVGVDVIAGDQRNTIYFPQLVIPLIVQGLSSSYFSIQESITKMEEDDAK